MIFFFFSSCWWAKEIGWSASYYSGLNGSERVDYLYMKFNPIPFKDLLCLKVKKSPPETAMLVGQLA